MAASGTLTFAAGVTTQPVSVTVNGDVKTQANETLVVNLLGPYHLDDEETTITNDDEIPTLSIDDVAVAEGNAGTMMLVHRDALGGEWSDGDGRLRHRRRDRDDGRQRLPRRLRNAPLLPLA